MKYCSHCGNQLVDEAIICPKCGCPTDMFNNPNRSYNQNTPNAPAAEQLSALSIVGFIFAFLVPIAGLICSIIAHKIAVTENNLRTKSFSKSGIIVSAVFIALSALFWVLIIVLAAVDIATDPNGGYYYSY